MSLVWHWEMVCMGYILYTLKTDKKCVNSFSRKCSFWVSSQCRSTAEAQESFWKRLKLISLKIHLRVTDDLAESQVCREGWVAWRMCLVSGHGHPGTQRIRISVTQAETNMGVSQHWQYRISLKLKNSSNGQSQERPSKASLWSRGWSPSNPPGLCKKVKTCEI